MSANAFEVLAEEGLPVKMPSGATFFVLTQDEVEYLTERVVRYLSDNHFVNVSDFQDIDRMLVMELFVFRWGLWLSREKDYFGEPIEKAQLRRSLKDYSDELRQVKKLLGIDKVARDKQRGEDSVATYIENLRRRAKEFGVTRETQLGKALELFNQLKALMTLHDGCDATERQEMHVETDDVLDWIRTVAIPDYDRIDEHFRNRPDGQKYWVRNL